MIVDRIKVSKNFYLDEFVDPHTYINEPDHGRSKIDDRVIAFVQLLRDHYGKPIQINTWWWYYLKHRCTMPIDILIRNIERNRNIRKWSGIRTKRTRIGAKSSAHRVKPGQEKGLAADPKGPEHVFFKIVEDNAEEFYMLGLRRLEDPKITKGWLHMDCLERNTKPNSIRVVDLKKCTMTIRW